MTRLETIETQLIKPWADLGHRVMVAADREAWQTILTRFSDRYLGNELRYGWTLPFEDEDGEYVTMAIAIYPDLIVKQTEEDSDNRFHEYLNAVEYRLNWHFAWFGDTDKTDKIDAMLYDQAPGSMEILNSIQLRVLDQEANANG